MVALRNEKGQFVKKVVEAVKMDPAEAAAAIKDTTFRIVTNFAQEVYGEATQKTILKAYRKLFDASYTDSYAWLRQTGLLK